MHLSNRMQFSSTCYEIKKILQSRESYILNDPRTIVNNQCPISTVFRQRGVCQKCRKPYFEPLHIPGRGDILENSPQRIFRNEEIPTIIPYKSNIGYNNSLPKNQSNANLAPHVSLGTKNENLLNMRRRFRRQGETARQITYERVNQLRKGYRSR